MIRLIASGVSKSNQGITEVDTPSRLTFPIQHPPVLNSHIKSSRQSAIPQSDSTIKSTISLNPTPIRSAPSTQTPKHTPTQLALFGVRSTMTVTPPPNPQQKTIGIKLKLRLGAPSKLAESTSKGPSVPSKATKSSITPNPELNPYKKSSPTKATVTAPAELTKLKPKTCDDPLSAVPSVKVNLSARSRVAASPHPTLVT